MNHVLENDFLRLSFDGQTGALLELLNKRTGWQVIRQPRLAGGFALLVPTPEHRSNQVRPEKQRLSVVEQPSARELVLYFDSVVGDKSGRLPIAVSLHVTLDEEEATFVISLKNQSELVIEEVWCPYVGGLRGPADEADLEARSVHMCGGFNRTPLGDGFPFAGWGYWGVNHPRFVYSYPNGEGAQLPFLLLTNDRQGLYLGMHSHTADVLSFVHELRPGFTDAKHRRIPKADEVGGVPAGFVVSAVRSPFIAPRSERTLAPMVMRLFSGTWHEGLRSYSAFRATWFRPRAQPAWVRSVDCWLTLQMSSPEGCCHYRYSELPAIAADAKAHGVGALQLIGWARGGQDGDEPLQDINPSLGTRDELRAAIAEIEALGVRVLLMCKFKWADQSLNSDELRRHALRDMFGNPTQFGGYAYQTIAQQLTGGSRRAGFGLCHASADYRRFALAELDKLLDLGSSGLLYDELANHMLLCFSAEHGHARGASNVQGSLQLIEAFYERARQARGDFLIGGEGPNDFISQYVPVNYVRSWDWDRGEHLHTPVWKFMNPAMTMATCIVGWDDREMLNQCLAYGYVINYEPYNFKGRVSDIADTAAYGSAIRELREQLAGYLWLGTFRHTVGAELELEQPTLKHLYSVFERADGRRAVVVVNEDPKQTMAGRVRLPAVAGKLVLHAVDRPPQLTEGVFDVPPRSCVVVVETDEA